MIRAIGQRFLLPIPDATHVSEARRMVRRLTSALSFTEVRAGRAAIVVTECGTNIARHTTGGYIVVNEIDAEGTNGIELIAMDRGPGMQSVEKSLEDGYSAAGGSGTGLGAIRRLADEFDVYSLPGSGSAILARIWKDDAKEAPGKSACFEAGAVSIPAPGEDVCGDAAVWQEKADGMAALVVDGLGHGLQASEAAAQAVRRFEEDPSLPPEQLLEAVHKALRQTRGAAGAAAVIDPARNTLLFCGIGNISAAIADAEGGVRSLASRNGILGYEAPRMQEYSYPWTSRSLLVMHSDGVSARWSLDRYPGLLHRHPSLIAGTLHRDFARPRDDATVVVVREREALL